MQAVSTVSVPARATPEDVRKVADDQDSWTPGNACPRVATAEAELD